MNKKVDYTINDLDLSITVVECKTQREILEELDELLEMDELHPEYSVFEDMAFHILYNDGSTYDRLEGIEDGTYKKRNIKAIVYDNPQDTWVYGEYDVNEYGVVSYK